MVILQYQFVNMNDKEVELIPQFNDWMCSYIKKYISTTTNYRKIQIRIPYLYKVSWMKWTRKSTDVGTLINTILSSIYWEMHDKNYVVIKTNNILIPNTKTSVSRLIRFLNYGDINNKGIGLITNVVNKINKSQIMSLWQVFVVRHAGYIPKSKIITDR